jgi:dTDP-4-amino-4,6-dideoxygalactose transaminase
MIIPYLNLKQLNLSDSDELKSAFDDVLNSGWFILGKKLEEFENQYANYNKTKYCVGLANGLDALILALKALNIGDGDEVIVPSNTYIASWLAVSCVGAVPIPVEPNWLTCNIDSELIEVKISSKTKAIMPVNLYGQAAELHKISAVAKKHNLFVLEDNAQAQGAFCEGKLTGTWGDINATSFYPAKNLGALGDAGAITTNDVNLFDKVKVLRNYGSEKKYYNEIKGVNSRLDELQAAFLTIKLKSLNQNNIERQKIAKFYDNGLQGVGDILIPVNAVNCNSVYHIYQIRTSQRNQLQEFLNLKGIGNIIHYPVPSHLQKAYNDLGYGIGAFPIAEKIASTTLSIPLYPGLTQDESAYIVDTIKLFFNGR